MYACDIADGERRMRVRSVGEGGADAWGVRVRRVPIGGGT